MLSGFFIFKTGATAILMMLLGNSGTGCGGLESLKCAKKHFRKHHSAKLVYSV